MKLSIIIPFRASLDRTYVMERLENFEVVQNSDIEYILVDSGSPFSLREKVSNICNEKGMRYLYQDTENNIFAIGSARDYGVEYSVGEFVTFLDIDLVCVDNFIDKLFFQCKIEIEDQKKSFFTVPCFYLTQDGSELFLNMDHVEKDEIFFQYYLNGDKEYIQNLAPSSSVMVVRRNHYLAVGGHNPVFKGHGYEDFELIHRLLRLSGHIPRSREYYTDTKIWDSNSYRGFRATFSMLGQKALLNKLYVYHIWHPRPPSNGYEANRFTNHANALDMFKKFDKDGIHPTPLLNKTQNVKNVLFFGVPFSNASECLRDAIPHLGNIVYTNEYYYQNEDGSFNQEKFQKFLDYQQIELILFTNPYGNNIRLKIYHYVKQHNLKFYCFDRGALPDSWFFDPNGFNFDSSSYHETNWLKKLTQEEEKVTCDYIDSIFRNGDSLEHQSYRVGKEVLAEKLKIGNNKVLFVPFQRPSDTVIKYFTSRLKNNFLSRVEKLDWTQIKKEMRLKDYQFQKEYFYIKDTMDNFRDIIDSVAKELRTYGWHVIVKQHPSETYKLEMKHCTVVPDNTNMYDLIELADSMALINSGMGLYAMMAMKPCFVFGDAFYRYSGLNIQITQESPEEIASLILDAPSVDRKKMLQFIHYLITKMYSFGEAQTFVRTENDGSKRTITRYIDFYRLTIDNKIVYSYDKDKKFVLPFGSPLFNRFKLDMAQQRNQPVAQKPVAQKPVAQKPVAQKPVAQKPVAQKNEKLEIIEQEAIALFKKGLFQKSIDMFYQAIEQEGDLPRLRRELAEVLYTIGNRGEALKQLSLALEKIPNNKNLKRRILKMKYGSLAFWVKDNSLI